MTEQDEERAAFIAGLREIADRLERHPDAVLPYDGSVTAPASFYTHNEADFRATVKALGGGDKSIDDHGHPMVARRVGGYEVRVFCLADVCERVVTGTREVEVVEWRFPPSILRDVTPDEVGDLAAREAAYDAAEPAA